MSDTNLQSDHNWHAQMISPSCDQGQGTRGCFLRKEFILEEGQAAPQLFISALGLYRAFVNGQRVGMDLLTPGWTCYDQRIAYQEYSLEGLTQPGENTIEIWLADGWYRSPIMWKQNEIINCWGDRIGAIVEIFCEDRLVLKTDQTWQAGHTPILRSGIYYGEDYDARLELTASHGVEVLDFEMNKLVPHEIAPVKELEALTPIDHWDDESGRMVLDFGQNVAGYLHIQAQGNPGDRIQIEYSEVLGPDRFFDNRNYRGARAAAEYILKGGAPESWSPMFTFMGYRYARLVFPKSVTLLEVKSIPISSVPQVTAGFTCSEPSVERLVLNTIWSQRGNFIEVPTDCPQRDERLGWTGDAQVFSGTACWLADCNQFLRKYLRDLMHDQRSNGALPHFTPDPTRLHPEQYRSDWAGSTGWGDAITVIPWQHYLHYGDATVLKECFPAMLRWLDYLWNISDGPIIHPANKWFGEGFTFGDWLQPSGDNRKPRPTIADDCAATLYHFISTQLAKKIAQVLGEDEAAEKLTGKLEEIRTAFEREYFSLSGRLAHNDQTSYALAFLYDLVPDAHFESAKGYFRKSIENANYLIGTGFIGTPALLPALTKVGLLDLAEKVFLNREVPGWLYQVERGATTIWERWDAMAPDGTIYSPEMNSYNHYAYGAVCQWLFEQVAGISPTAEKPGFDEVQLNPQILPNLNPISMWHDCRHGRIEARWEKKEQQVDYRVTLPAGCQGRLMPNALHQHVQLNGNPVSVPPEGHLINAGSHQISFELIAA
ncbi:MAG: family 78 glycoside hydrolase catalytic domain [bacterium]